MNLNMEEELMEGVKEEVQGKETLCRLCASYTQLLIPIFEGEGLENSLSEKIDKYLPIQVTPSDYLPLQVCFQCASTVISWHELTATCVESERKLKAMFGDYCINSSDVQLSPGNADHENADDTEEPPGFEDSASPSNIDNTDKEGQNLSQDASVEVSVRRRTDSAENGRCLQEVKLEGITEKLMCQICNIQFSDPPSLSNHVNIVHSIGKSMDISQTFLDISSTEGNQMRPVADEKSRGITNQSCKFCGRYFRHATVLNMHSLSCLKLQGKFDDSSDYSDYVTIDDTIKFDIMPTRNGNTKKCVAKRGSHSFHGSSRGISNSEISKKTSPPLTVKPEIKSGRRSRQSSSKTDKRVSCAYCIKSFSSKYDAISHVQKVHRNKLEEFLKWLERRKLYLKNKLCSMCDQIFSSNEEATNHFQRYHQEKDDTLLTCELCNTKCEDESDLLKHIADHSTTKSDVQLTFGTVEDKIIPTIEGEFSHASQCQSTTGELCGSMNRLEETKFLAHNSYPPASSSCGNHEDVGCIGANGSGNSNLLKPCSASEFPLLTEPFQYCGSGSYESRPKDVNFERICETGFSNHSSFSQEEDVMDIKFSVGYSNDDLQHAILKEEDLGLPFLANVGAHNCSVNNGSARYPDDRIHSLVRIDDPRPAFSAKGMPIFECSSCNSFLVTKGAFLSHCNRHCNVFKNFCPVCWKYSSNTFELVKHLQNYHRKLRKYSCQKCGSSFFYRTTKRVHSLQCQTRFKCQFCCITNDTRKKAAAHKLFHLQSKH